VRLGSAGVSTSSRLLADDDPDPRQRVPGLLAPGPPPKPSTRRRLHTGDVGKRDADRLFIVDRKKHIIITAGGKNLTPSNIETRSSIRSVDQLVRLGTPARTSPGSTRSAPSIDRLAVQRASA
jgi:acyl-CoA synthetase (AMP-forming)/AMP-acid ligase II